MAVSLIEIPSEVNKSRAVKKEEAAFLNELSSMSRTLRRGSENVASKHHR